MNKPTVGRVDEARQVVRQPAVGDDVAYTNWGDKDGKYPPSIIAAKITEVRHGGKVCIVEFFRGGVFFQDDVEFTTEPAGTEAARGKWAWPRRAS